MVRKEWKILFPLVINMEIRKILSPHKESNIRSFVWIKSNFNLANRIGINLKWSALISLKSKPLWTRIWFYFFLVEINICHTYLIKCPTSNRLLPCKKENLIVTQRPPPLKNKIILSAWEDHWLLFPFFKFAIYVRLHVFYNSLFVVKWTCYLPKTFKIE